MKPTIFATLIYLVDPDDCKNRRVIMAIKERKVGQGCWFGYGGKMKPGETADDCIRRELKEESRGVVVEEKNLERVALIDFYNGADRPTGNPTFRVLAYRASTWQGIPRESVEMKSPKSHRVNNLPWKYMKPGDELFVMQVIMGNPIKGWIRFSDDEARIVIGHDIVECTVADLVI